MSTPPVVEFPPVKNLPVNLPFDKDLPDDFDPNNIVQVDRSIKNNETWFLMVEPGFNLYPTGLHVGLGTRLNLKRAYLDFMGEVDSNLVVGGRGVAKFGDPFFGLGGKLRVLFPIGRLMGTEFQLGLSLAYQGNVPFVDHSGIYSSMISSLVFGLGGANSSVLFELGFVQDFSQKIYPAACVCHDSCFDAGQTFMGRLMYNFSIF